MNREDSFKTIARCAPANYINDFCKIMRKNGYTVNRDRAAATLTVTADNGVVVATGLQMGAMGWILRADPAVVKVKTKDQ
jgi:hypothetical protein